MENLNLKTAFSRREKAIICTFAMLTASTALTMAPTSSSFAANMNSSTGYLMTAKGGGNSKEKAISDAQRKVACPTGSYAADAQWNLARTWFNNTWFSADIKYKCIDNSLGQHKPLQIEGEPMWTEASY